MRATQQETDSNSRRTFPANRHRQRVSNENIHYYPVVISLPAKQEPRQWEKYPNSSLNFSANRERRTGKANTHYYPANNQLRAAQESKQGQTDSKSGEHFPANRQEASDASTRYYRK